MTALIYIEKKWRLRPLDQAAKDLSPAKKILHQRGIIGDDMIERFMHTDQSHFHDPFMFFGMDRACERVMRAINERQRILIYGDYDCDGVTSVASLCLFLKRLGADVDYVIPDRTTEGYGMNDQVIERILKKRPDLIITVDCGIANTNEIEKIKKEHIDVIVTDHHERKDQLPPADVILCTTCDASYPFSDLAGVGVALKLIAALCQKSELVDQDAFQDYLDLAAIGTLADVVSLLDENRAIVKMGLQNIAQKPRVGIVELAKICAVKTEEMTETAVTFILAPRLNAAGRMGDASDAVKLLMTSDAKEAKKIAHMLDAANQERQTIEAAIFDHANQMVADEKPAVRYGQNKPIVLCGNDWHPGVIGIVASRLSGRYNCPAIVLTGHSGQPGYLKGSCRSNNASFDLVRALDASANYIDQYGGHPQAAGISVKEDVYEAFKKSLADYAEKLDEDDDVTVLADLEIDEKSLAVEAFKEVLSLGPFGQDHPRPLLMVSSCELTDVETCGKGRHLKLKFIMHDKEDKIVYSAIFFGEGPMQSLYSRGMRVDMLFWPRVQTWRGKEEMTLDVKHIRPARVGHIAFDQPEAIEKLYQSGLEMQNIALLAKHRLSDLIPKKHAIKGVYLYLRQLCQERPCLWDYKLLALGAGHALGDVLLPFSLARILDIFFEAGLIDIHTRDERRIGFSLLFVKGKVKLEDTTTFKRLYSSEDDLK